MLTALTALSFRTSADILVRFPKGFDIAYMAASAKEIQQQVGMHAVGVVETAPEPSDPAAQLPPEVTDLLDRARTAYKELNLKLTAEILSPAETLCLDRASYEGCRSFLFDVDLLRGMALDAMGERETAAQAFRSAHIVDPAQVVDPRRFPPDIVQSFAKACAVAAAVPPASLALISNPKGASFWIDGHAVDDPSAHALSPGRHIVRVHLLGYDQMWGIVEVDSAGKAPGPVRFDLVPLQHINAWKSLVAHISTPDWRPDDPGLPSLMNRFKIQAVVLFKRGTPQDHHLVAEMVVPPQSHLRELPSPGAPGAPICHDFTLAIREEMGLVVVPPVAARPTGPLAPEARPDEEESEGAALEEDEDPSVRFQDDGDDDGKEAPGKGAKLVKSPWFWISIGIVTAIVTGMVVATQVGD